jgi:hypothetical protein
MSDVKIIELTKRECDNLLGQFLDESHYDTLLNEDCDVYLKDPLSPIENGEHNVILMFRKNYFTKEQQAGAYDGLMNAAKPTQNRGLAAGPKGVKCQGRDWATTEQLDILAYLSKLGDGLAPNLSDIERLRLIAKTKKDTRGMVWLGEEKAKHNFDFEEWLINILNVQNNNNFIRVRAQWVLDNLISDTTYANPVDSGIAGWFDRYPRIPYGRATAYTAQNFDKFQLCYPFMRGLSDAFKELLPTRYKYQMDCAHRIDPGFRIPKTPLTTITVNKNFRTAAHRDAGDLADGFSNLTVVARDNDYDGGYLVLPEVRAAVNIRPGDLLLVANHDYIHGNTPIISKAGTELERISLVCYFREKMLELGTKEYEDLRYAYVEHRRKDPTHALAREAWNGVSAGMFDGEEFRAFAEATGHLDAWAVEHQKEESSLESLFG